MNEGQIYSIIHFDMFDKGTVVCVSVRFCESLYPKKDINT